MSFAKKPLPIKGSKKPEKSPLEQIQMILGNDYTVEQITNALNQTADIQNAIKILKSEREALQNNSKVLKFQQLNKAQQIQKRLNKYNSRWVKKVLGDVDQDKNKEMLSVIQFQMEKITLDSELHRQIIYNFSIPSRDHYNNNQSQS
ncbi:unnamed protein product (macronuclear) [Paramecium tetraurelia]|uniref:Uncharacterized protein n=1 Tax=Paramecium tetraurelia TaxID=5888 RepID=A0CV62_PARTE|nr:uncharacterized protein GSPATT00010847001 [Paramecium tetraurelia]CAK74679.1 unnamed protein product [Paramecium tetraurelia]|eukprot:XP_001442076.1 hypothetical protein (macronuclear) [Paramecium tetraurelia strain d4-2]